MDERETVTRVAKKLFVSMAGNIGAGKTTAAKLISQQFGFELFDEPVIDNRFLRDYYRANKWQISTPERFRQMAEDHCACDLGPLFQEWVYD